jgi:hypothetical protein
MPVISFGWLKCVWSTTSLASVRPRFTTRDERVGPLVVGEELLRHDRGPFVAKRMRRMFGMSSSGCRSPDLLGAQVVRVTAGDHDVLELGARRHVGEDVLPAILVGLEAQLLDSP